MRFFCFYALLFVGYDVCTSLGHASSSKVDVIGKVLIYVIDYFFSSRFASTDGIMALCAFQVGTKLFIVFFFSQYCLREFYVENCR